MCYVKFNIHVVVVFMPLAAEFCDSVDLTGL